MVENAQFRIPSTAVRPGAIYGSIEDFRARPCGKCQYFEPESEGRPSMCMVTQNYCLPTRSMGGACGPMGMFFIEREPKLNALMKAYNHMVAWLKSVLTRGGD